MVNIKLVFTLLPCTRLVCYEQAYSVNHKLKLMHLIPWEHFFSRFSRYPEANASRYLENLEKNGTAYW